MKKAQLVLALISLAYNVSFSQYLIPGHVYQDYYRVFEIENENIEDRINYFPALMYNYAADSVQWDPWNVKIKSDKNWQVLPVALDNQYNTEFFDGYNDGAVWKGRGFNSALTFGATAQYSILKVTFAPILNYAQNNPYLLAPVRGNRDPYNYQFARIDYVQRYGDDPLYNFNWGQTEVRLVYKSFTIGATTSNMIWGPAQVNPILMSNNAAGIPRIEIGTDKPINTIIGKIEGKIYWGLMRESDFFDSNPDNDNRYWNGYSIGYSPKWIPGLKLGVNRSIYKDASTFTSKDIFIFAQNYSDPNGVGGGNDEYDQMLSVTARWIFKEVGFDIYLDYGKNDFGSWIFGMEPEHARGYSLGFNKIFKLANERRIIFMYEHTSVDKAKTSMLRPHNSWYEHGIVNQGYTNDGQIIGSKIGPGSVSDYTALSYVDKNGMLKLNYHWERFNDDYFYYSSQIQDRESHDIQWNYTITYHRKFEDYLVGLNLGLRHRKNMYFIKNEKFYNWVFGLNVTRSF